MGGEDGARGSLVNHTAPKVKSSEIEKTMNFHKVQGKSVDRKQRILSKSLVQLTEQGPIIWPSGQEESPRPTNNMMRGQVC